MLLLASRVFINLVLDRRTELIRNFRQTVMRDKRELMVKFAKIVERHPEIYDQNLEAYKTRQLDASWEKVASSVRNELKEECTVEELRAKWKGIRSSFNRYKSKLINPSDANPFKKYYLYDTLKFLDPFTKPKGSLLKESIFEECGIYEDESKSNSSTEDWALAETKPNISDKRIPDNQIKSEPLDHQSVNNIKTSEYSNCGNSKKRKYSSEDKGIDDDNEDLQFFKSILPDIRDFTNKEKRKLKMGILRLIDDLENERKQL
ncbi:unnamed protein product [Arctia plantaginis]|uniref:Transcription factor Adf-1 n=1 Tax=Arctia plantaginis TaxID=874455 RepID=A0A8S1A3B7_ARCPL|nr:unnamed protein product [Arctia plantaginis]